ncbi:MAG: hypothetical protein ACREEM_56375 [Blastocatellia bacterium]
MEIPIIVAIISAATAVTAAIVSAAAQRSVKRIEQRFEGAKRSLAFRSDQLAKLYLPVSMHLRATRALATTHYDADEDTRTEIEHALHEHNKVIVECLLSSSMYLEPDAPDAASVELLEHLLQWETLYKLKYQSKPVFSHPIWAEIRRLGYTKFPDDAAEHFHVTASRVRNKLNGELKAE